MPDLTKDQFDQLPEFVRDDYKEVDGVYKHAGMMKVKQTANDLDSRLKARDQEFSELSERMTTFEQDQQRKIDEAKEEALKNAKTQGDVDKIEEIHAQQMKDLETRVEQRTRDKVATETAQARAVEKANTTAARIAGAKAIDEDSRELLEEAIAKRIKPDEQGNVIFLNEDGTASSLDENGFIAEIEQSKRYKRLLKAVPTTTGGGMANGSGNGGGRTAEVTNTAAEDAKKKGDIHGYLNAAIKINL